MRICSICDEISNFEGSMCFWCEREQTDGEMFREGRGYGIFRTPRGNNEIDKPVKVYRTKRAAEKAAEIVFQFNQSQYYIEEAYDQEAE